MRLIISSALTVKIVLSLSLIHICIEDAAAAMEQASCHICEWDETLIRQLVDTVKVHSAEKITVYLRGGVQVDQDMI